LANLGDFGELEKLWGAVRDIEKISRSKSENKLEEVWNAVKEIPKEQFDVKFESEIIKNIELSVANMYMEKLKSVNDKINITTSMEFNEFDAEDYKQNPINVFRESIDCTYKLDTYQQTINGTYGVQYVDIEKRHDGICILLGYSGATSDKLIRHCSIKDNNNAIRLDLAEAETVVVTIAEIYPGNSTDYKQNPVIDNDRGEPLLDI
jgi:hypothetical protein